MPYLWECPPDGDIQRPRQRGIEVARRVGDLKTEICSLDALFLLMADTDPAAARKIHQDLVKLERDPRAAQTFFWPRMGEEARCAILEINQLG